MLGNRSFGILGAALVAFLAVPQGLASAVSAAPSQARPAVAALSAQLDLCDHKGSGCQKGYEDGLADGRRCIAARPGHSPNAGEQDYGYGYTAGHQRGWGEFECGDENGNNGEENGDENGDYENGDYENGDYENGDYENHLEESS
ncbi:hypothetical protein ACTWPT_32700 [Nonomuraea sp. 3N208]|uniref:hypothetical protein n=1 Tax=Nonomuraea sp. 3N208 TaxID=3457421 RepID=UPI003FD58E73